MVEGLQGEVLSGGFVGDFEDVGTVAGPDFLGNEVLGVELFAIGECFGIVLFWVFLHAIIFWGG